MKKRNAVLLAVMSVYMFSCSLEEKKQQDQNPNIVLIYADDLGYGDLSCYGQETLSTPHIDKMAAEGILFTDHYAGSTVCGTRPGDVIIEDYNGDGVINADDRQILGSPIPTYFFGITNSFQYNGFDMSIFVNGSGGNHIFQDMGREFDNARSGSPQFAHWVNRWRSPEEPGDGITPGARGTGATNQLTSRRLWKGDYVRLKNITLGYTLPQSLAGKINASKLRIYAQGENLYLWDHYKVGFTPEADLTGGDALTAGRDYGAYPSIRTFLLGINVSF